MIKCSSCFHLFVCDRVRDDDYIAENCGNFADAETTFTYPAFTEEDKEKISAMVDRGYAFVSTDFIKRLISESKELADIKLSAH